jgi:hypothetical protein
MEKDIGKISKNDSTDIVIRVDEFGGRPGVTIREFVTSERYTGFTKSGVKIPAGDFQQFKELIGSIKPEDLEGEATTEELPKDQKTLESKKKEAENMPDY